MTTPIVDIILLWPQAVLSFIDIQGHSKIAEDMHKMGYIMAGGAIIGMALAYPLLSDFPFPYRVATTYVVGGVGSFMGNNFAVNYQAGKY